MFQADISEAGQILSSNLKALCNFQISKALKYQLLQWDTHLQGRLEVQKCELIYAASAISTPFSDDSPLTPCKMVPYEQASLRSPCWYQYQPCSQYRDCSISKTIR